MERVVLASLGCIWGLSESVFLFSLFFIAFGLSLVRVMSSMGDQFTDDFFISITGSPKERSPATDFNSSLGLIFKSLFNALDVVGLYSFHELSIQLLL